MRINEWPHSGGAQKIPASTGGSRSSSTALAAGSAAAYAAVHSALLTPSAEKLAEHVFGGGTHRWYRLSYNVLAIALLELQDALLSRLPDKRVYALTGAWRVALPIAGLASLVGLGWCLHHTDAAHFLGVRQSGWRHDWMASHPRHVVDTGPYGVVRHPTYWCMLGVLWLRPSLTQNRLTANLVYTLYLAVASFLEEQRLVRELGPEYITYRRRVPRLFPSLKPHRTKASVEVRPCVC